MKMKGERNDRQPGDLGERHHPILHYITWPARSIRRNRQVITALGPRRQLEHRLWPAPARGAAHGLDVERFQDRREESAVLAGADHRRHPGAAAAFSGVAKVSPHRQRQPVMPNAEDYRACGGAVETAGPILPLVAQRSGQAAHERKDQPRPEPLAPTRRMGHDHGERLLALVSRWRFIGVGLGTDGLHHAPFFKQKRTRSSILTCEPSAAWARLTESWASICLNPSAINASTASFIF